MNPSQRLAAIAAFTALAVGVVSAQAATTAVGPYYASPSWDQTLPASARFIVLANMNDEAVLDRETGLVWQRSPNVDAVSWLVASEICIGATTGNRLGWRLPTVNELASLLDPTMIDHPPPLPQGHPFTGLPAFQGQFWTATPVANYVSFHYQAGYIRSPVAPETVLLHFQGGPDDSSPAPFWCVRGGLLATEQ
jgi:hypothetical protein